MATIAGKPPAATRGDNGFFLRSAFVMTAVMVAGFSIHLAFGRSTFAAPLVVHLHAVVFMGWMVLYLLQNIFASSPNLNLHRRLGWIGAAWLVPMLVMGCVITVFSVRAGRVPFFFQPQQFLIFDPVSAFSFAGLTIAAIIMRRQSPWHKRLHFCAMTMLLGPGFGRLLPMPLLAPWASEAVFAVMMLFPLAGILSDLRRTGRVHPAWRWGIATMIASLLLIEAIAYSPLGGIAYRTVIAGSPGAAIAPLTIAPPPGPR